MKSSELLLLGGLAIGAYFLLSKKTDAATPTLGGGGGTSIDFGSLLGGSQAEGINQGSIADMLNGMKETFAAGIDSVGRNTPFGSFNLNLGDLGGLADRLPSTGDLGAFDINEFFGDFFKNFGNLGVGDGGIKIPDVKIPDVSNLIPDFDNLNVGNVFGGGWTDAWNKIKAGVNNVGQAASGAAGIVEAVGMTDRVIFGGIGRAMSGENKSTWEKIISAINPVAGIGMGIVDEMKEIAGEKYQQQYGQYTVNLNTGIDARGIGRFSPEGIAQAAARNAAMAEKYNLNLTPQKVAAAKELPLGNTPEAPSASEPVLTRTQQNALAAQKMNIAYA